MTAFTRFAAFILMVTLLAGCAVTYPVATPTPSAGTSPSATGAGPATGAEDDPVGADGASPRVLDAELLGDLLTGVDVRSDTSPRLYASQPRFGKRQVDQLIADYFTSEVDSFQSRLAGHPGGAELNLGWGLLASSPSAVGIAVDGYVLGQGPAVNRWRSFWFDPASGRAFGADDLADHAATLAALRSVASAAGGVELDKAGVDPLRAAPLVAFTPSGELLVGFDQCQVADCSRGRVTVTIPRGTTDSLLSDAGRASQAATLTPTSPTASTPAPSPAPTRSTPAPPTPRARTKVDCRKAKCIALTFDDGPAPTTRKLLAHLAAKKVRATFFMLGQQVQTYPKLARAVSDAGHEVGVHTWDHRDLTKLSSSQIDREIASTVRILREDVRSTPKYLRPPYGAMNADVHAAAKRAGLAMVLWNVDTLDWKTRSAAKTRASALKHARRGSIILVHDIHKWTVAAIPAIIDGLRAKGYQFVTVSTLLGKTRAGQKYFHG